MKEIAIRVYGAILSHKQNLIYNAQIVVIGELQFYLRRTVFERRSRHLLIWKTGREDWWINWRVRRVQKNLEGNTNRDRCSEKDYAVNI